MKNREIYQKDPSVHKLANQGVASVNDDKTAEALEVLRYELETFVCDGQYEKGLAHILDDALQRLIFFNFNLAELYKTFRRFIDPGQPLHHGG